MAASSTRCLAAFAAAALAAAARGLDRPSRVGDGWAGTSGFVPLRPVVLGIPVRSVSPSLGVDREINFLSLFVFLPSIDEHDAATGNEMHHGTTTTNSVARTQSRDAIDSPLAPVVTLGMGCRSSFDRGFIFKIFSSKNQVFLKTSS